MVTKVKKLTLDQLKMLIEEAIEEKLQEYLGDPDEGLELREEVVQRLKTHRTSKKERVGMEQVAKRYGLELK